MRSKLLGLVLVSTVAFAGAHTLTTGDALAPLTIADQHGKAGTLDEQVRVLLFSRDMTANKLAKKAFMDKPPGFLPAHHAMYLIDVSRMPGFVTRHFAIPKMRKYRYRIFLDQEGELTRDLPSQEDRVTVVRLDGLKVRSIDYAASAEELIDALEPATP